VHHGRLDLGVMLLAKPCRKIEIAGIAPSGARKCLGQRL
jgi:hypothetical protein